MWCLEKKSLKYDVIGIKFHENDIGLKNIRKWLCLT